MHGTARGTVKEGKGQTSVNSSEWIQQMSANFADEDRLAFSHLPESKAHRFRHRGVGNATSNHPLQELLAAKRSESCTIRNTQDTSP